MHPAIARGLPAAGEVHLCWWQMPPPASAGDAGARSRWVWGHVRERLALYAGCEPAALEIRRSDNGKPLAPQLRAAFSLAHDDKTAVLAVSATTRIGVDVLGGRTLANPRRLARRLYGAHELAHWETLPAARQAQSLRARFCAIEAVVKALDWRLWEGLGNIRFLRQGRVARVPLKRAQLHLADGERGGCAWALAMDAELGQVLHFEGG